MNLRFCWNSLLSLDCQNGLGSDASFRWASGRGFVLCLPMVWICDSVDRPSMQWLCQILCCVPGGDAVAEVQDKPYSLTSLSLSVMCHEALRQFLESSLAVMSACWKGQESCKALTPPPSCKGLFALLLSVSSWKTLCHIPSHCKLATLLQNWCNCTSLCWVSIWALSSFSE